MLTSYFFRPGIFCERNVNRRIMLVEGFGVSVDFRYRSLDRDTAPLGLTFDVETHADRIDETTAAVVRNFGTGLALAF
jgi:hypothetical protein